jgi:hypothetical protein
LESFIFLAFAILDILDRPFVEQIDFVLAKRRKRVHDILLEFPACHPGELLQVFRSGFAVIPKAEILERIAHFGKTFGVIGDDVYFNPFAFSFGLDDGWRYEKASGPRQPDELILRDLLGRLPLFEYPSAFADLSGQLPGTLVRCRPIAFEIRWRSRALSNPPEHRSPLRHPKQDGRSHYPRASPANLIKLLLESLPLEICRCR